MNENDVVLPSRDMRFAGWLVEWGTQDEEFEYYSPVREEADSVYNSIKDIRDNVRVTLLYKTRQKG